LYMYIYIYIYIYEIYLRAEYGSTRKNVLE
jgi:hypothetical protein